MSRSPVGWPLPSSGRVVVFGSLNMDLVTSASRFAVPGETLTGHSFQMSHGGKGANQALACARLGVPTALIGRVGSDEFGRALLESLGQAGVDVRGVRVAAVPTGTAHIQKADGGENSIVVIPGANHSLDAADLGTLDHALQDAAVLLLQLELPLQTVLAAARLAVRRGVPVILDPAPAQPLPPALLRCCFLVTPNESEAAVLTGAPVSSLPEAVAAAQTLIHWGASQVVIKRGRAGAYWTDGTAAQDVPALQVTAVDTVAAGDAFNGGLAVALAEGRPLATALAWAAATAAVSVTRPGAQASLPDRQVMLAQLNQASLSPRGVSL